MELEEHHLVSADGQYARKVWWLPGAGADAQKLCVFLDAEFYLAAVGAPTVLADLQAKGSIPLISCIFVSHLDGEARHHDYTCNPAFSQFIAEDVVSWALSRQPGCSRQDNFIGGLSLSGLASAYLGLTYPGTFSRVLCQSGSFWWNAEWLTANAKLHAPVTDKFWLSVGDKETDSGVSHAPTGMRQEVSQLAATQRAVSELQALGAKVRFNPFLGGHDPVPWKEELPLALKWLLSEGPIK
jgi:enterochelin esterase family protein